MRGVSLIHWKYPPIPANRNFKGIKPHPFPAQYQKTNDIRRVLSWRCGIQDIAASNTYRFSEVVYIPVQSEEIALTHVWERGCGCGVEVGLPFFAVDVIFTFAIDMISTVDGNGMPPFTVMLQTRSLDF